VLNLDLSFLLNLPLILLAGFISTTPVPASAIGKSLPAIPNAIPNITQAANQPTIELDMPIAAKLLPDEVLGVAFVNTNLLPWQNFARFNPYPGDPMRVMDQFLPKDIKFRSDIQPWLTDRIAIAFLPSPKKASLKADLPIVIVLPTRDRVRAASFLDKLIKGRSKSPTQSEYQGVKLFEWQVETVPEDPKSDDSKPEDPKIDDPKTDGDKLDAIDMLRLKRRIAIAALPDYILISPQAETIKQLIDAQTNLKPLSDRPEFQRTLQHPQWQRSILAGYGDHFKLITQLIQASGDEDKIFAEMFGSIKKLKPLFSLVEGYVWLQPNGIRTQSIIYYPSPQPVLFTKSDKILDQLPSDTYISISSNNLRDQWFAFQKIARNQSFFAPIVSGIRSTISTLIGLDLERDILPWMEGEFAVILFPNNKGFFQTFEINLGLGLVVQTTNQNMANAAIAKLGKFASKSSSGAIKVVPRRVNGRSLTSWEIKPDKKSAPQSVFAYGWANRNTLVFTTGSGPMAALNPKPAIALSQSLMFKNAMQDMPKQNLAYFYMDMQGLTRLLYDKAAFLNEITPAEIKRSLNSMRGAVVVYSSTAEKFQSDFFLGLAPLK
jgi:hypothetical protein